MHAHTADDSAVGCEKRISEPLGLAEIISSTDVADVPLMQMLHFVNPLRTVDWIKNRDVLVDKNAGVEITL